MSAHPCDLLRFEGSPADVGYAHGTVLRASLRKNLQAYNESMRRAGVLDVRKVRREWASWFDTVASHYRQELEGIARGAEIPLDDMVQWLYGSAYAVQGCTSVIASIDGRTWIAHNNDWYDFGSHRWTAAIVRHIDGKIPHLTFGLQGDVCVVVGINQERLWLHMNGFFARDERRGHVPLVPYVLFIREALENCQTIEQVEDLIRACDRDAGMAIYVVDGKTEDAALFECGRSKYVRRDASGDGVVVSCSRDRSVREMADGAVAPNARIFGSNTRERVARLETLLTESAMSDLPADLIRVLADPVVEDETGTVYSNVACPGQGLVWFGRGSLPAASTGTWHRIEWPWS